MQAVPFSVASLLSTGGWVSGGKILAILAGVAVNALLTRMLSPEAVGVYFLVVSIVSVAVLLAQLGLNQVVVRFIADLRGRGEQGGIRDVVLKSFAMVALASALAGILYILFARIWAVALFHSPLMAVGAAWLAVWIVLNALRSLAAECLRGFEDIGRATLFEGLLTSLLFLLFIAWLRLDVRHAGLHEVILAMLVSSGISMGFALFSLRQKVRSLGRDKLIAGRYLITTAMPLLASNILFVFLSSFGLWVVGYLATAEDAAQYGAATRLVALAQFPLLALNAIVPPMIARMHARNEMQELQHLLRWCASLALLLTLPVILVFLCWGGGLLELLFGDFYAGGRWILVMLGLGVLANAWAGYCGPALMMSGHQQQMMRLSLLTVLITVPLSLALGMFSGAVGVALAMSVGITILHILLWLSVRKHLGIWTHAGIRLWSSSGAR